MTGSRKGQIPKVVRKGRLESLQERTEWELMEEDRMRKLCGMNRIGSCRKITVWGKGQDCETLEYDRAIGEQVDSWEWVRWHDRCKRIGEVLRSSLPLSSPLPIPEEKTTRYC